MKQFIGNTLAGRIVSVHSGNNEDLSKEARESLTAEIGGFVGDKHQGFSRKAWDGEWEPAGTLRRNERQWSGVSVEELTYISEHLALTKPLSPDTVGANLCVEGISEFSLLPKGSKLVFPSGAVLLVEEYNPPCVEMGAQIVAKHGAPSDKSLTPAAWVSLAAGRRGLVGIVDVPGIIRPSDEVEVRVYEEPAIAMV